jgi:hypothetical protein
MFSMGNRSLHPKISVVRAAFAMGYCLLGTFKPATATDLSVCFLLSQLGCCAYYLWDGNADTSQFREALHVVWFFGNLAFF